MLADDTEKQDLPAKEPEMLIKPSPIEDLSEDSPEESPVLIKPLPAVEEEAKFTKMLWNVLQHTKKAAPVSSRAVTALESLIPYLHKQEAKVNKFPLLKFIQKWLNVDPFVVFVLFRLAYAISLFKVYQKNSKLWFYWLCLVGPVKNSLKGIERPRLNDDERWLTFWSVFGVYSVADAALKDRILEWTPRGKLAFDVGRLGVFWWLSRDGSLHLYRRVLRPLVSYL